MDHPHSFRLIDGVFTAEEAARILGAMVKGKIDHHSLELHSRGERDMASVAHSEQRLRELRELNDNLKDLLGEAIAANRKLKVKGIIEIDLAD